MKKIVIAVAVFGCIVLSPYTRASASTTNEIKYVLTDRKLEVKPVKDIVYQEKDMIPLTGEGRHYGYANIKYAEKLNSSSFTGENNTVYDIVVETNFTSYEDFEVMRVSGAIDVGGNDTFNIWTGLSDYTLVYKNKRSGTLEFRSEVKELNKVVLKLETDLIKLDPIKLSTKIFTSKKVRNNLLNIGEKVKYTTKDGSIYEYSINKVYPSIINKGKGYAYDIEYSITRLSYPSVGTNNKAIVPKLILVDTLGNELSGSNPDAERYTYLDTQDTERYVTTTTKVELNKTFNGITNIYLGDTYPITKGKVRIKLDFTSAINKLSIKELLKFNGRGIAYDVDMDNRVLYEYEGAK